MAYTREMLYGRREPLLKRGKEIVVRKLGAVAGLCLWALWSFAPLSLDAQEYGQAGLWLTIFERVNAVVGTGDTSPEIGALSIYGRFGFTAYNSFFFKSRDGQVLFHGYKNTWPEGYAKTAAKPGYQLTSISGGHESGSVRLQSNSVDLLYRVIREDSVIYIEKAYFEESAKRLRQLNLKKKADRNELRIFEDNPLYVLDRQGDKVDIWEVTSTLKSFVLLESIVITGAGNTLKFYNGRPPFVDDADDWTIKVTHSGFVNDRLSHIEAKDSEMGWLLRQKGEAPVVGVSKGVVSVRAQVGAGRLYTANMTDESFIVNVLLLFGQSIPLKSHQYGTYEPIEISAKLKQTIHFKLGNFRLRLTGASSK